METWLNLLSKSKTKKTIQIEDLWECSRDIALATRRSNQLRINMCEE